MKRTERILVAIPSHDRPEALKLVLKSLSEIESVYKIIVVADASSEASLDAYRKITSENSDRIVAELHLGSRGSARARNALLLLAARNAHDVSYVLLMDDDYVLPNREVLEVMIKDFEISENIGVVGGRVINLQRRTVDPDFSLRIPSRIADLLTRLTGFIFDGAWSVIQFMETTSPFMLMRIDLLGKVSYDENYEGTGYREETDLQMQVIKLGFKILSDSRAFVYHLCAESGGCRRRDLMCSRMYWKARNHAYFLLKWDENHRALLFWHLLCGVVILVLYRVFCLPKILSGLRHGYILGKHFKSSLQ